MKEVARFGVVGVISTLLSTGVALGANQSFGFNTMLSNITGFSVAVLFSFTLNTIWSFPKKIKSVFFIRSLVVDYLAIILSMLPYQVCQCD